MAGRLLLPISAGFIAGSAVTLYYNNPSKVHTRWHWDWDNRFDSYSKLLTSDPAIYPLGKRVFTLVRHSQYQRIQGDINDNKELTELGKKQAILTGQRLKDLDIKFDKIYTSKFTRAQQTCNLIVNELENNDVSQIIYNGDLNEGLPTMIEPFVNYRTRDEFIDFIKKTSPAILNGFKTLFHRRDKELMEKEPEGRENILIVGHGNVFRYYMVRLLQLDRFSWARLEMHNCSISRVCIYDDGRVRVTHIGDTGHLPPELLTSNAKQIKM